MRHYLSAIEERVAEPPSFDELWLGYRRHMLYGLWAWLLTTERVQPELRIVNCVFRYGMAALDLDSLGAL